MSQFRFPAIRRRSCRNILLFSALGVLLTPLQAQARYDGHEVENGGTIQGQVTFKGERPTLKLKVNADQDVCLNHEGSVESPRLQVSEEGGVANAVVYLKDVKSGKPMNALEAPMELDQEGCLYKPFVQVMPQAGVLTLINSDPLNHNVHARQEGARDPFNYAMPNSSWPEKQTIRKRMIRPGRVSISCDVHMWMNAYLFVVEHPYYAVTGPDGHYELKDVPPGEYEVHLWHAGWDAELQRNTQGQVAGYAYSPPVEKSQTVTVQAGGTAEADFVVNE